MRSTLATIARTLDPRRFFARSVEGSWHRLDFGSTPGMPRATPKGALSIAAAWACQNAIATDLAALPLVVMRREGASRRLVHDHPASEILGLSPDGVRTAIDFRQAQQGHAIGYGNGISEIRRDRMTGEVLGLRLEPAGMAIPYARKTDQAIGYRLSTGRRVRAEDVIHISGFGSDGLSGYSPIEIHRQTIELGLASAIAGHSWYKNGAMPSGWVKAPKRMDKEATERFLAQFERRHSGPTSSGRIGILDEGKDFLASGVNPRDAQYLELREFTVLEICRIYRVPPHKICDFSQIQLASSAVEAANIEYVATTLVPWAIKWEQQLNLKLFTSEERRSGLYVKHNFMALLRGDMKTRAEYYRLALSNGWMTRDEVRSLEDLDPLGPDRGGDKVTVQGQMIDLSAVSDKPTSTKQLDSESESESNPEPAEAA